MKAGGLWQGPPMPELMPGLEEWYNDFFELSTDRQIGMAAGQIPWSSIERWTEGWPYDEADCFHACMRAMDAIYLKGDKSEPPGGRAAAVPNIFTVKIGPGGKRVG